MGRWEKILFDVLRGTADANISFSDLCSLLDTYEIIIFWSDSDNAFVAEAPELPGCMAHGDTQQSAFANIRQAMRLWLDTAREFGDVIPPPKGHRPAYA